MSSVRSCSGSSSKGAPELAVLLALPSLLGQLLSDSFPESAGLAGGRALGCPASG